jgi:hypothetical protein
MRGLLGGDGIPLEEAMARTRHAKAAQKFLDGQIPHLHHQDIDLAATSLGKDGLVLGVRYEPRPLIYSLS